MDEWVWMTRAGVAVAIVLSVGNTTKLILDARRTRRADKRTRAEEERAAAVEKGLADLLEAMRKESSTSVWDIPPNETASAELGAERGILKTWWSVGTLKARLRNGANDF